METSRSRRGHLLTSPFPGQGPRSGSPRWEPVLGKNGCTGSLQWSCRACRKLPRDPWPWAHLGRELGGHLAHGRGSRQRNGCIAHARTQGPEQRGSCRRPSLQAEKRNEPSAAHRVRPRRAGRPEGRASLRLRAGRILHRGCAFCSRGSRCGPRAPAASMSGAGDKSHGWGDPRPQTLSLV